MSITFEYEMNKTKRQLRDLNNKSEIYTIRFVNNKNNMDIYLVKGNDIANAVNEPKYFTSVLVYNLCTNQYESLSKNCFIKEVDLHIIVRDKPCAM